MDKNYDVITYISRFILRRPGLAIFAEIIKILTMFIVTIFKNSRIVEKIKSYISRFNLCL